MICAWIETSSADTGSSHTIELRLERQRPGDADALALAAGELGREAVVVLGVEADELHQLLHLALALVAVGDAVDGERVADDRADATARVQRAVRVLEHHLHLAAQRAQLGPRQRADVGAVEHDPARGEVVQPGHAAGQRGLAAAGLPHQPERLAALRPSRLTPSTARSDGGAPPNSLRRPTGKYLQTSRDLERRHRASGGMRPSSLAARQKPLPRSGQPARRRGARGRSPGTAASRRTRRTPTGNGVRTGSPAAA